MAGLLWGLAIQIAYDNSVVDPDIISLLTRIASCLVILNSDGDDNNSGSDE